MVHRQSPCTTFSLSVGRGSTNGPSSTERWIELGWPDPPQRKNVQKVDYWVLGEPKATAAILQFLSTTKAALPPYHHQALAERARRDDEWGLEDLEEAERTGDG